MAKGRKMPAYSVYSEAYDKKEAQLKKQGLKMFSPKMSQAEYVTTYKATLNTQKREVKENKRKRTGMIVRDMVNDQAYKASKKQIVAQKTAAETLGIEVKGTLSQLMAKGNIDGVEEAILARQDELYKEGKNSYEVALTIGQEYFGSN